jgi:RNA polymerase sigma factor (sigma-70 family)
MAGGFEFRYCLEGETPAVATVSSAVSLVPGDLIDYASECAVPAVAGNSHLVGVVLDVERGESSRTLARVITNADAVYAVADNVRRPPGASLGVCGESGGQGVVPRADGELEVVVDCTADDEVSLVRIKLDRHSEVVIVPGVVNVNPTLSPKRERDLLVAAAVGNPGATADLVEAFLPAIGGIGRLYRNTPGVERAELLQEGVVGLLRAVKRYDVSLGTPFWAYASWWVRQAMQQLVAQVTRPIVLSDRALRGLARIRDARRDLAQEHGREPTTDEVAVKAGLTREQAEGLLAIERPARALEEPVGSFESTGTLADFIEDPEAESEYAKVLERIEIDQVRALTEGLSERERAILAAHYGLGRPAQTLREIGDDLGVSPERVRQLEERALAKLRDAVLISTPTT